MVALSGEPFPFPRNVNEALNSEDKEFWTAACNARRNGPSRANENMGPPIDLPKGATSMNMKFLFLSKQYCINLSHNDADSFEG